MEPTAPVIIGKDLYKCYAGFAPVLRGVNIEVMPGEMAAIMGPSGCGKSTMLHILGMLHAPDSGSLEIMGTNVLAFDREQTAAFRRGNMGFVMQSSNLFEHSTVFENVEFPLIYENVPQAERWERVIRALELVRLSARVHYRSNRLSGGEQQRVAIARAMVNNPRILLADEPTGALDARTSVLIMENFRSLCHSGGVCMVMVTHDPKMAEYCDSVYTLEDGVLVRHKRELKALPAKASINFLKPPPPLVRGALAASRFPDRSRPQDLALAQRLHGANVLSRIYGLRHGGFLANPEGYALPLPVRRIGWWLGLRGLLAFFRHARKNQSAWFLWRHLPARSSLGLGLWAQLKAFARGRQLASFALEDRIEFFISAEMAGAGLATWVGARLARVPFSFVATAKDLTHFDRGFSAMARDAAFVLCESSAFLGELKRRLPDLPEEKFLLLRPGLLAMPEEDPGLPPQAAKKLQIRLAEGEWPPDYAAIADALAIVRKSAPDFQLRLAAPKNSAGVGRLRKVCPDLRLSPPLNPENVTDFFLQADIFLAFPQNARDLLDAPDALPEAMAFGLAVIGCDAPCVTEFVADGQSGVLCRAGDAKDIAGAILKLAGNAQLRESLGRAARRDILELMKLEKGSAELADRIVLAAAKPDSSSPPEA